MEVEKLKLSQKKCIIVHIGKSDVKCPTLKIHGEDMKRSKQETYLGDKIDYSGKLIISFTKFGKSFESS